MAEETGGDGQSDDQKNLAKGQNTRTVSKGTKSYSHSLILEEPSENKRDASPVETYAKTKIPTTRLKNNCLGSDCSGNSKLLKRIHRLRSLKVKRNGQARDNFNVKKEIENGIENGEKKGGPSTTPSIISRQKRMAEKQTVKHTPRLEKDHKTQGQDDSQVSVVAEIQNKKISDSTDRSETTVIEVENENDSILRAQIRNDCSSLQNDKTRQMCIALLTISLEDHPLHLEKIQENITRKVFDQSCGDKEVHSSSKIPTDHTIVKKGESNGHSHNTGKHDDSERRKKGKSYDESGSERNVTSEEDYAQEEYDDYEYTYSEETTDHDHKEIEKGTENRNIKTGHALKGGKGHSKHEPIDTSNSNRNTTNENTGQDDDYSYSYSDEITDDESSRAGSHADKGQDIGKNNQSHHHSHHDDVEKKRGYDNRKNRNIGIIIANNDEKREPDKNMCEGGANECNNEHKVPNMNDEENDDYHFDYSEENTGQNETVPDHPHKKKEQTTGKRKNIDKNSSRTGNKSNGNERQKGNRGNTNNTSDGHHKKDGHDDYDFEYSDETTDGDVSGRNHAVEETAHNRNKSGGKTDYPLNGAMETGGRNSNLNSKHNVTNEENNGQESDDYHFDYSEETPSDKPNHGPGQKGKDLGANEDKEESIDHKEEANTQIRTKTDGGASKHINLNQAAKVGRENRCMYLQCKGPYPHVKWPTWDYWHPRRKAPF